MVTVLYMNIAEWLFYKSQFTGLDNCGQFSKYRDFSVSYVTALVTKWHFDLVHYAMFQTLPEVKLPTDFFEIFHKHEHVTNTYSWGVLG